MFIEIDRKFLSDISTDSDRVPKLYYSRFWLVRTFFWMRLMMIYNLIRKRGKLGNCMDFCGGGGVFLPTLSSYFNLVTCVDLESKESEKVISHYNLRNIKLIKADVANVDFEDNSFDVIVAADVLEHFRDLSMPVNILHESLSKEGFLYTSLPSESCFYRFLRKLFAVTPPNDHYHDGYSVERFLAAHGFKRIKRRFIPFYYFSFLSVFIISEWKKNNRGKSDGIN